MPNKENVIKRKVTKMLLNFDLTPQDHTWEYLLNEGIAAREYSDMSWDLIEDMLMDKLALCDKAFGM